MTVTERDAIRLVDAAVRTLRKRDRRPQVALRRALGRAPEHPAARAAHMVVAPFLPEPRDTADERAFYAVASMIAAQPRDARDQTTQDDDEDEAEVTETQGEHESLGTTLGRAVAQRKTEGSAFSEATIEARLHLLCRQDIDGLHRHLPRLIARLRSDLVPVDWVRLVLDLSAWGRHRDHVSKRWLQDYYRTLHAVRAMQAKKTEGEDQ